MSPTSTVSYSSRVVQVSWQLLRKKNAFLERYPYMKPWLGSYQLAQNIHVRQTAVGMESVLSETKQSFT
jgi:hypothetical protein